MRRPPTSLNSFYAARKKLGFTDRVSPELEQQVREQCALNLQHQQERAAFIQLLNSHSIKPT